MRYCVDMEVEITYDQDGHEVWCLTFNLGALRFSIGLSKADVVRFQYTFWHGGHVSLKLTDFNPLFLPVSILKDKVLDPETLNVRKVDT